MKSLFEHKDYKTYLSERAGPKGARTGFRSGLAEAAGCNLTYVSQVLSGPRDFSLEQAEQASAFLGHTPEERHYFLLLVQKARAGTKALEKYFEEQLDGVRASRLQLKNRIAPGAALSKEHQYTYYSSWIYAAVHVGISIPQLQTKEALARYLHLRGEVVQPVLDFLVEAGLAVEEKNRYRIGPTMIHLGNDSKNILRHHANWRARALVSLEKESASDLHYSAAVSVSRADAIRLKSRLMDVIQQTVKEIGASPEEEVFCFALDFFGLKESV